MALNYVIKMMKELGLEIVAEGVESEEQRDTLVDLGCDYLQGYYYSKPVPEEDFIRYASHFNID